jgi:ubiquitin C
MNKKYISKTQTLLNRKRKKSKKSNLMTGGMKIIVRSIDNTEIALEVESSDTIEAIKERINSKTGFPEIDQRLIHNGRQLENSRTLADYQILPNSMIMLVKRFNRFMPVDNNMRGGLKFSIKFRIGNKFCNIDVSDEDTVRQVKNKILSKCEVSEKDMQIVIRKSFGDILLKDDKTMGSYGFGYEGHNFLNWHYIVKNIPSTKSVEKAMQGGAPITLFIRRNSGDRYTLEVDSSDTIEAIKASLSKNYGIPEHLQRFVNKGNTLHNGRTLADYNINNGNNIIDLVELEPLVIKNKIDLNNQFDVNRNMEGGMNINVRKLDNTTIPLEVESSDTIDAIKERINSKTGIPENVQRLIYNGKQLEDTRTLAEYGIKPDAEIRLVLRLIGPLEINMEGGMRLVINNINDNEIIHIEIESLENTTIEDVKRAIERKYNYPVNKQLLHYNGKVLRNHYVLLEYINLNNTINLTLL